jgi:hypothetical protein
MEWNEQNFMKGERKSLKIESSENFFSKKNKLRKKYDRNDDFFYNKIFIF